jgi:hypothetical protein
MGDERLNMYQKGQWVSWRWGQGQVEGTIQEYYDYTIHKVLQGTRMTRHGTPENPAYLIERDNGFQDLKLHTELSSI